MADDSLEREEMMESADEFEAAYQAHATPIYKFLYWRTRDAALSDDLTSSVFEKAWRHRSSFRGGSQRAWLQRIARNLLIDHWRRQKEVYSSDVENLAEPEPSVDINTKLDQALLIERLEEAMATLPDETRQIIHFRFVEGLSARQVGQKLKLSENNVRIIQYRALRKLRSYLSE